MIYMFDIDGTLTEPRQKMSQWFEKAFVDWAASNAVYLVTGSDLDKVKEQVPESVLRLCSGIFTCMGNELWRRDGRLVYKNEVSMPEELIGWLKQQVEFSECPVKTSNHLEFRTGMLNFSSVGRNASVEQRQQYYEWDKKSGERARICGYINRKYQHLEACIGGQISVDIQGRGMNKSQAYRWVKENFDEPIYFFGDRCEKGGNDYAIVEEIDKPHSNDYYNHVSGPDEVIHFLLELEEQCLDI